MVPYVIEGVGNKEKVYDLYSRLLKDRIVFIGREFTNELANSVTAQLLFLEADDPTKDIVIYINSPGGNASDCMAIFDVMNYVKPEVSTVCVGQASSAAAFILASGASGKRMALKNSRIMMHMVRGGYSGAIADAAIHFNEMSIINETMVKEWSKRTGRTLKQVQKDLDRDNFMSAEEAKNYGIIDKVLIHR